MAFVHFTTIPCEPYIAPIVSWASAFFLFVAADKYFVNSKAKVTAFCSFFRRLASCFQHCEDFTIPSAVN